MKIKLISGIVVVMAIILTACGSVSIADASKKMKTTLAQVNQSVTAGDSAKVKAGADGLEEDWAKFEDDVKKKDAALYEKVEDPLHAIKAGGSAAKLDAAALNKAITDLNAALDQVQNLK